jgi:pyruvate ferredoxin oxidoreductase alpha subunit
VFDRAVSYGSGGVLANEVKAAMYGSNVNIHSVIAGLGGKDVRPLHFQQVMYDLINGKLEEERWLL